MKALILIIVSIMMLFGFNSLNKQSLEELAMQPGETAVKSENKNGELQANMPGTIQPPASKDIPDMEDSIGARIQSTQEQSGPGSRGPGLELFNFSDAEPSWYTVNDDVMGGASNSLVVVDKELQRLSFSGNVSLENNGGFASTRSQWFGYDLSAFDGIALRVLGDGNTYRLRIRTEVTGSAIAYTGLFETEADSWQEVYIPFSEMVPLYRGVVVGAAGPLDPKSIRSFGLMLADKQQGEFLLDVDWINAVAKSKYEIRYAMNTVENEQILDSAYVDG